MKLSGWGRYPIIESKSFPLISRKLLRAQSADLPCFIPYGNGRSYGDSALADRVLHTIPYNKMLSFDEKSGRLICESGVLLSEIIEVFLPRGWFLQITPGTKLITVGGAIASDVHGKNHHQAGCFSQCVESFSLWLPSGQVFQCSRSENVELFYATCGGMGLTGVILEVILFLKKVPSAQIEQTTFKTSSLLETLEVFENIAHYPYSVAWIDCLSTGKSLGRSLVMCGDFKKDGVFKISKTKKKTVPFDFPNFALNSFSVKLFNFLYYHKAFKKIAKNVVDIDTFFYPLDAISHWNRIYGRSGFLQYQFILPKNASIEGLTEILEKIARSGMGSFLAVLKLYGQENQNYLSFPLEGYSLALDFKFHPKLLYLLDELDQLVLKHHGRIYLAKDARVSKAVFEKGYPRLPLFKEVREKYNLTSRLQSKQSQRLGL